MSICEDKIISESIYDCKVGLPQYEKLGGNCANERFTSVAKQRKFWKLTIPKNPRESNPNSELLIPMLAESPLQVLTKMKFEVDKNWFSLLFSAVQIINKTEEAFVKMGFLKQPLTSYDGYKLVYKQLQKTLSVSIRQASGWNSGYYVNQLY